MTPTDIDQQAQRLQSLTRRLTDMRGLSEEAQAAGAQIIDLLVDVEHHPDRDLLKAHAAAGLRALCAEPPNIRFAQDTSRSIGHRIRAYRPWVRTMRRRVRAVKRPMSAISREAPATWLLTGLVGLILFAALVTGIAHAMFGMHLKAEVLGLSAKQMGLVFVFGALGAGVSILQRLEKAEQINSNPVTLFCTGLTKPIVGAASALFMYVLVTSKIVPVDLSRYNATAFFASVAFLAGFSERLLPDLAKRAESVFPGAPSQTPQADADPPRSVDDGVGETSELPPPRRLAASSR